MTKSIKAFQSQTNLIRPQLISGVQPVMVLPSVQKVIQVSQRCREKKGKWKKKHTKTMSHGAPFSHLFTELKISPIEVYISAIELEISPIQLKISAIELQISPNRPIWRYLQFIWRYLQFIWRYLQIRPIWRYLQFIWRYLQIDKCDTISAPRRKNRIINYIVNYYNYRHKRKGSFWYSYALLNRR